MEKKFQAKMLTDIPFNSFVFVPVALNLFFSVLE